MTRIKFTGRAFLTAASIFSAASLLTPTAMSQGHPTRRHLDHFRKHHTQTINHLTDSTVCSRLDANAPQGFDIPAVPKFAIFGKDDNFYLGIGGTVKGVATFDWGNPIDNPDEFVTSGIPMSVGRGNKARFNGSAMQSQIYFNFVGLPGQYNEFGAFLDLNFLNNYTPVIQYAYMKYRGIKVGYDHSLFSNSAAEPPTIDFEGPCSSTSIQHFQANYTLTFGKKKEWKAGAGIEMPEVSMTTGANTEAVSERVPSIPAFIQYSWDDEANWIHAAVIMRNMQYRDLVADKNINKVGWGVALSGSLGILPRLTGYWQGVYGRGVTSYIQDCTGLGLDMTPVAHDNSRMNLVKAWGTYAGLQYDITDHIFISGCYSMVRTYAPRYGGENVSTPWGEQYRYGQYVTGNIFWNINALLQAGLEYNYGRRMDYSGCSAHDNRLQAMLQLSF